MTRRHVICIGGAPLTGKSTLAEQLSKKLGIPWVSTDDVRKWMQALVRKEDYPDLFYSDGLDAEAFYERHTTPDAVLNGEIRQGRDVQKGILAMVDSFWLWDAFIVEGIALEPAFVRSLQSERKGLASTPVFLVDDDQLRIQRRLDKRGLWSDAGTYPDHLKPKEFAWTLLYNRFFADEAALYGFHVYNPDDTETIERDALAVTADSIAKK